MTVYGVFHYYDEEGEFGDPFGQEDLLGIFEKKGDAEAFISKYENPHIYCQGFVNLEVGNLRLEEINIISHNEFDLNKEPKEVLFESKWWEGL